MITAGLLVAVTAGCWQMLEHTPTSFIPREDQGIVRISVQLPEGAAFPRTEAVSTEILEHLKKNDARKFTIENPLSFMQYPVQPEGLEMVVPCEARTAGAIIYYPMSMLIATGIC